MYKYCPIKRTMIAQPMGPLTMGFPRTAKFGIGSNLFSAALGFGAAALLLTATGRAVGRAGLKKARREAKSLIEKWRK